MPVYSYICLFAILGEFVRNFGGVCSQFCLGSFLNTPEEIDHFADWEGEVKGRQYLF